MALRPSAFSAEARIAADMTSAGGYRVPFLDSTSWQYDEIRSRSVSVACGAGLLPMVETTTTTLFPLLSPS